MSKQHWNITNHVIPTAHIRQYPRATRADQHTTLRLAVKHYIPRDNRTPGPKDVTIIAAHANGVGKELYEPLWDDLYEVTKKQGKFKIKGIWIADVAWQGESGVLNEDLLGNDPSWYDHPRDLLHMINTFRDDITMPIVGIGHSMGGNNIVNLSLIHPRLFASVILIDPVIQRNGSTLGNFMLPFLSTFRRDIWASREEAAASFRKSPFYKAWDPRVLDLWIESGVRDLPTTLYPSYPSTEGAAAGKAASTPPSLIAAAASASAAPIPAQPHPPKPVTLTTTKHQEVFSFLRSSFPRPGTPPETYSPPRSTHADIPATNPAMPFYRPEPIITFSNLPYLRPRCFYVFAEKSPLSSAQNMREKLEVTGTGVSGSGGVKEGGVGSVLMKKAGHFVPFERTKETAERIGAELGASLEKWSGEVEEERREWNDMAERDKFMITDERTSWMVSEKERMMPSSDGRGNDKVKSKDQAKL